MTLNEPCDKESFCIIFPKQPKKNKQSIANFFYLEDTSFTLIQMSDGLTNEF